MTVLVYLPYLPRTPALLFFFCLVPFWRRHPDASSVLSFSVFLSHDFTTLCHHSMHLSTTSTSTSSHFIIYHSCALNDGQSFSQSPSSNCVHYKVYFILHFIMYTFYFLLFFFYVPLILVKSPTRLRIFFLVLSHFRTYNHPLCPSIPSALVYLHSLSFFSHAFVTGTPVSHSTLQFHPSVSRHKKCKIISRFFI